MVQGYSFWREHMIEQMCSCFAFPTAWFWSRSWKRNAWNYLDIFYEDLLQVTFDIRTGNTKDGWKKHGINRQPFFWFGTPSNKIEMQMTKIPKESADQKDIVWYYHGSCMPKTLLWSKAILLGGSTWLSKCVRALHFPLLGFEAGLERENAWNYCDIFYEDLLQVTFAIRTGNTKDGWKKHGINRQPFFWFGTPSNKIMTKIPKESADQKDIVWYYHGSCMPKTLSRVQGYSSWREHMIQRMCSCFAFPTAWFWSRSWKRKCVKLLGSILRRPTPSYIRYPNW